MDSIVIENFKNQSIINEYIANVDKDTNYFIVRDSEKVELIASIKYLGWDSNIFNKKIGMFDIYHCDIKTSFIGTVMKEVNKFCLEENYDCLFAKAGTDKYDLMHLLESNGYKLMDSIVTLKTNLNKKVIEESNYNTRVLDESDLDTVLDIIDNLYSYGRFYIDSNLDNEDVNKLYKQWITNEIRNSKVDVIGIEVSGKVVGFISCKYRQIKETNKVEGIISLVGIDKTYQGIGIGKQLMKSILCYFKKKDMYEVYVGTQIDNISALNFYISNGFKITSSTNSFHKWI